MGECAFKAGRCARTRALACLLGIAFLATARTGPAAAAEFEIGEIRGNVDTTVSAGASMRVQDRDCKLIHVSNGGCSDEQRILNSDDGDLNYDKWDVYSNMYKATVDVDLAWRNFGGFFRGTVFYDLVTMETNTDRTPLDRDARYRSSALNSGVVGMGYQLLDAYLYGNFDVAGRPLDVRVGNQVLSWGESLFYQGGISSINTVDLNRLRAPGSALKEAFLPAPMVRVSAEILPNLGIEAFYQLAWNYTQLDPVGSYWSTNDLVGRAAKGSYVVYDPGIDDENLARVADELANPEPVVIPFDINADCDTPQPPEVETPRPTLLGATPENLPRTAEELFETGHSPVAPIWIPFVPPLVPGADLTDLLDPAFAALIASGLTPRVETNVPAYFPFGFPRLKDERARSQGQWGVALRYFVEAIGTEFGAYYLRIHDKVPSVGFVVEPVEFMVQPTLEDLGFLNLSGFYEIPACCWMQAVPAGYFREYPEDINVFGLSAATELFGIAWGAEISYKTRNPVQIDGEVLLRDMIDEVSETRQRTRRSGFSREKRLQAQINAIATIGPGDPYVGALVRFLHISSLAATVEVAAVEFPSLDSDIVYQAPNSRSQVDELSWGYQTLIQGSYDNPLGIPITVTPRIGFIHDVHGNTPGLYPFIEHRKSFSAGVNVDYLGVWQFDLAYTNSWGAGAANLENDRDFVSMSLTRSF